MVLYCSVLQPLAAFERPLTVAASLFGAAASIFGVAAIVAAAALFKARNESRMIGFTRT